MIQNNENGNRIKENKYKILRMSLLLGNDDDREETISNFEDAAREIDAMNDDVYSKDIESKFYDTLTLEEEEKKLSDLVDYIGGRIDQRLSLLDDFSNVTGRELLNLPAIRYQEKLDEYKNRLFYIREYLENNKNIEKLNKEIDEFDNELNSAYVNKAKDEDRNKNFEEELANKYNNIVRTKKEFLDINLDNADIKLSDIKLIVEDSKKSLDIFNKSFDTLNQAGISGEERNEYLSYVNNAKVAYYDNKELEYLVKLYTIINVKETEYSRILAKRDSINDIVYERSELRKELDISKDDILLGLYNILEKQYDDISSQKDNIDNIEYLNVEIANRRDLVTDLIKDNQKVEILSLLKEFCIIDTYEEENDDKNVDVNNLNVDDNDNKFELSDDNKENSVEEIDNVDVNNIFDDGNNLDSDKTSDDNLVNIGEVSTEKNVLDNEVEVPNVSVEVEVKDNQIISVMDAGNIDVEKAIIKSSNVMKRVGDMLGVKVDKVQKNENVSEHSQDKIDADNGNEKTSENLEKEVVQEVSVDDNSLTVENSDDKNSEFDFGENIFMNDNFDADPEISDGNNSNNLDNIVTDKSSDSVANPLFNSDIANKTIDEVMADAKENNIDENNDFWFSQEDAPVDLNSLPDIDTAESSNNTFFGSTDSIPNLDFPSLDVHDTEDKEEAIQ